MSHQQVAGLGQRDELLVPRRAHVEADGQHFLQCRHDQRRLDGVKLTPSFLVPPLLVLAAGLEHKEVPFSHRATGGVYAELVRLDSLRFQRGFEKISSNY